MAPGAPFHSSASRALRRCTITAHWWRSKFQATRTTVSYVSCGTHPAARPRQKPRPSVCPDGCPAMGAGSREASWVGLRATLLLRAPFGKQADAQEVPSGLGNKRMRKRFLAELRLKPHVCRVPESLLIIHNTQRDNLRNFQNYG